jgi:O-acetylhomoserine/O-acetylserine sulfhydrylase-like pyridoxal-dependent enzyme
MGSRADDLILPTVAIDDLDDLIADLDQTLQKV